MGSITWCPSRELIQNAEIGELKVISITHRGQLKGSRTLLISLDCHFRVAVESSSDLKPANILVPILASDGVRMTVPEANDKSDFDRPMMVNNRASKSVLFVLSRKTMSKDLLSLK